MDVYAQQPPDQEERNDCKENALNPLACRSRFATFHLGHFSIGIVNNICSLLNSLANK
jgi:hypothetical protein